MPCQVGAPGWESSLTVCFEHCPAIMVIFENVSELSSICVIMMPCNVDSRLVLRRMAVAAVG